MLSRIAKLLFGLILTFIVLGLIVVTSLGVWVLTGPKSISKLVPYVESSLNKDGLPYKVRVKDAILMWESWLSPIDFRLRGVALLSQQDAPLLTLNELSLKLDFPSLLRFKVVPHSIVLHRPNVYIFRDGQGEFLIGFGDVQNTGIPLRDLFASVGGSDDKSDGAEMVGGLQRIAIRHARLTLGNETDKALFTAPDANLELAREGEAIRLLFAMDMQSEEYVSTLQATAHIKPGDEMIVGQMRLSSFSPHLLARLFPDHPEWGALSMPLDGEAAVSVDAAGNLSTLDFRLEGRDGIFTLPEHFAEPLPLKHALLEGQFRNNLNQLLLNQAALDFGGATLSLNGFAMHSPSGWTYDALAVAENMPVNDLYKYWPKTLAPTPYEWVTTHIRDGKVPHAEARVSISEDALTGELPKEAIAVTIQAEGVNVEYMEGHPRVQDVKGIVTFDGKGMEITSKQGAMLSGSVLKEAYLAIPELMADAPRMHIQLAVEAPAADVASYLAVPDLNYSAPLGLDPKTISGQASGRMRFDFILPDVEIPDRDPELDFLIEADLTEAAQPGFMQEGDLTNVNGALAITQHQLTYSGAMTMSGVPLQVKLSHLFDGKNEYPTTYTATGNPTVEQLSAFGLPALPFMRGSLGLTAEIRRSPAASLTRGTVDATQVGVLLPEYGFIKEPGKASQVRFEVERKEQGLQIKSFDMQGGGININGSVSLRQDFASIDTLQLNRLSYGRTNVSGSVTRSGEAYRIQVKGPSLDLSPFLADNDKAVDEASKKSRDFPFAFDLQAEFGTLIFAEGEGHSLQGVDIRVNCRVQYCPSAEVQGYTGRAGQQESRIDYRIAPLAGKRTARLNAADAGGFLRAVDLFDGMQGGQLVITGEFDDADPQRPLKGRIIITEHTITNAPTLAKMASLLSLTGIADTLSGKGISFNKAASDMTYTDTYILLKNGKTIGPALGITVENGLINRMNKQVTFNGTVVPSYTLNSALGNIPLIGQALSGGEGQGVFAATYKVEGAYPDKLDVSVNPLAMLAPGFLRNIFGGSEEPELPKEEERLPGETPAEAAASQNAPATPEAAEQQSPATSAPAATPSVNP